MPLYQYLCSDCGNRTEEFRTMGQRHDRMFCNQCEGPMKLEFNVPSAIRTDTRFQAGFHGDGCIDNQTRKRLAANAARMGININGKKYDGRLARFQGDPEACYGTLSEARSICRKRGKASEDLGVSFPTDETTGMPYKVSDECVNRRVREIVQNEHGGTIDRKRLATMKEEVREQITPSEGSLL